MKKRIIKSDVTPSAALVWETFAFGDLVLAVQYLRLESMFECSSLPAFDSQINQ